LTNMCRKLTVAVGALLLIFVVFSSANPGPPSVILQDPNGTIFNSTKNVTLVCNASDTEYLRSVSLYTDINGTFEEYGRKCFGELCSLDDAVLAFHMNNQSSYGENNTNVYDFSGNGNNGTVNGAYFNETGGKFFGGFYFDGYDEIEVTSPSGMDLSTAGTIEMWIKPETFSRSGQEPNVVLLAKGPPCSFSYSVWASDNIDVDPDTSHKYVALFFDDWNYELYSSTYLSPGSWYHIAATWNGSEARIYVNGTLESSGTYTASIPSSSSSVFIGSNGPGWCSTWYFNGTIDEVAVYSVALSEDEIHEHYTSQLSNFTSSNWTITGIDDGSYKWNCFAENNLSETAWGSDNYTFHVDTYTPPTVSNISLSPSDSDSIDPGVNISVTANVSDISNVSTVILQYMSPFAGIYTNDSMEYNSITGLWENGTIQTTYADSGNWSYRIWSNDTNGNANATPVQTLSVEWDTSWSLVVYNLTRDEVYEFDPVSGFKDSEQTIGYLSVNNTGDSLLSFSLSESLPYISYNVTEPFDLGSGISKDIEVNATMPSTPNEYSMVINITSTGGVPSYREVNATIISFIGGPYINETTKITSYPSSITQGESSNFTGYVKNIGNETAYYVWMNWTFPSGWSITHGNATNMIGNLSPQESYSLTITASAGSSLRAGGSTVWLNATSNGTAGADSKVVIVSCNSNDGVCGAGCTYATDDDCEAPGGGGGSIVGTISVKEPQMDVSVPESFFMTTGNTYTFIVNVTNPVQNTNLTDVSIELDGYPLTLVRITPSSISHIGPEKTKRFLVEITVPPYIERKDYIVTIRVKANGIYKDVTKDIESAERVIFSVHMTNENETLAMIESAEAAIEEMKSANLTFDALLNMLGESRHAYENLDFDSAAELAEKVVSLKEKAFSLLSSIEELGNEIRYAEGYGLNVEKSEAMYHLAKSAFQRGDYKRADSRITAAMTAFQLETKDILPLIRFLREYWMHVLALIVLLTVSLFFARKRLEIKALGKELESIRSKRAAVKKLMKELQNEYYKNHEISKADYEFRKNEYHKTMAGLVTKELRTRRKLDMLAGSREDAILKSMSSVQERLKDAQRDYFELGIINRRVYEDSVKELQKEAAEIERVMKKSGRLKKSKGVLGFVAALAVVLLFYTLNTVHALSNVTSDDAAAAISEAENAIIEMGSTGYGIQRVNDTLANAKLLLSKGDYEDALATARYVSVLKQKAILADRLLDDVELRLYQMSDEYDVSSPQEMFSRALAAFDEEDYDEAEKLLNNALDSLDRMESEAVIAKAGEGNILTSVAGWVNENRIFAAFMLLVALLTVMVALGRWRKFMEKKKMQSLEKAIEDTKDSMRDLQNAYFKETTLSKHNYEMKMEKYKRDLKGFMEDLETERQKQIIEAYSTQKNRQSTAEKPQKTSRKIVHDGHKKPAAVKSAGKAEVTPTKSEAEIIKETEMDGQEERAKSVHEKRETHTYKKAGAGKHSKARNKKRKRLIKPETLKIADLLKNSGRMAEKHVTVDARIVFFKKVKMGDTAIYWYRATDETGKMLIASFKKISNGRYSVQGKLRQGAEGRAYIKLDKSVKLIV